MTERHPTWGPEDEELIRRALDSLREDVEAEPLPEPALVRARAEEGAVIDLATRRRRLLGTVAGVAAAGVVAASAGFLTWHSSDVAPPATTSSPISTSTSTSSSTSSAREGDLRMLGASEWTGALGRPVLTTVTPGSLTGPCFEPPEEGTWEYRVAQLSNQATVGRQWIGTTDADASAMDEAVTAAVEACTGEFDLERTSAGDLADGSHRIWRATRDRGATQWWLEVRRGNELAFLTLTEGDDRTYTTEEVRWIALGVLGDVDLAARDKDRAEDTSTTTDPPSTTSDPSPTGGTASPSSPPEPEPTSTDTPSPEPTSTPAPTTAPTPETDTRSAETEPTSETSPTPSTGDEGTTTTDPEPTPTSSSPSPTTTSETSGTSDEEPSETPDEGEHPQVGDVNPSHYVPAEDWASPALTGAAKSYQGPVEMEGRSYFTECTSADGGDRIGAIGIRSGTGDMNYFGRQYVLLTDEADTRHEELVRNLAAGCTGAPISSLGQGVYRVGDGDLAEYLGVARIGSGLTILHLNEAQTAPAPLTDEVARSEMSRLLGLASGR